MWYLKNIISTPWGFDYTIKFIIALSDLFDEWDEDRYYVFWWYEIPLTKNNIYYEFRVIKNYLETYDVNIMFLLTFWATMSYCFPNYLAMQATKIFLIYFYFIVNIFLVLFSFKKWVIYAYSIGIFNEIQLFLIIFVIFLFLHFPGSIRFILLIGFLGILYVLAWVIFFYHLFWLYTFFWNYDIELAVYLSPYIWFYIWIFLYFSSLRIFHNTLDYYNNLPNFNLNAIIDLFFFIPKKSIIIFLNHYKGLSYLETTFLNKLIMFYRKLLFSWLLKRFFFSNLTELLKSITPEHFNYLYLPHKSWFLLFLKDIRNLVLELYEFSITNVYISFRGSMGSAWWWTFYYNFFWWMDCPLAFWWSGVAIFIQKLGLKIYIFFYYFINIYQNL